MSKNKNEMDNKNRVYIRPEDVLELLLDKIEIWKTIDAIEENLTKMLLYFKEEKFDRLAEEFDLETSQ
jgi:hypothetical protein